MCTPNTIDSVEPQKQDSNFYQSLRDVYICVFFDGTSNNMYFSQNKRDKLKDNLEGNWEEQKKIAEKQHIIEEDRNKKDSNGNDKYSNVAILYSLAKDFNLTLEENSEDLTSIGYTLYVEGSGANPVSGGNPIGAGFGVGKTGVVALVSKAIRFVYDFLISNIPLNLRGTVNIHFANFGFSRGSTCARLFTQLLVREEEDKLPREKEFKQYIGDRSTLYNSEEERVCFLDEFNSKRITVDFLGIYDTVSSIGFLQREENVTNYGLNHFEPIGGPTLKEKAVGLKDSIADKSRQAMDWTRDLITGEVSPKRQKEEIGSSSRNQPVKASNPVSYVNQLHNWGGCEYWKDAYLNFHRDNVTDYGLYSPRNPKVKSVLHICALDEFRENFALVNLGVDLGGTNCSELFIPGCHSDVGGGYIDSDALVYNKLRMNIQNTETKKETATKIIKYCQAIRPKSLEDLEPVSEEGMKNSGWYMEQDYGMIDSIKAGYNGRLNRISIDKDTYGPDTIQMRRFVSEGYSNISLLAMMARVIDKKNGLGSWPERYSLFDNLTIKHNRFQIPDKIKEFGQSVLDVVRDLKKGERSYVIPEFEEYVRIRREFIHFTSTDKRYSGLMGSLKKVNERFKAIGANIGNAPYWKLENIEGHEVYVLCRLMYDGEKGKRNLATIYDLYK